MPYIKDEWYIEMALIPRLLYNLVETGVTLPSPAVLSTPQGQKELMELRILTQLLKDACEEPFLNLPDKKKRNLQTRVEKGYLAIQTPWVRDQVKNDKIALLLHYFLEEILDEGYLILHDGTVFDQALKLYRPMMEHFFAIPKLDKSAKKHYSELRDSFIALGYFPRPKQMEAAE